MHVVVVILCAKMVFNIPKYPGVVSAGGGTEFHKFTTVCNNYSDGARFVTENISDFDGV